MADLSSLAVAGAGSVAALGITSMAALRAWTDWLDLKRLELDRPERRGPAPSPEMAELKKRLRKLEAIADGVDR